MAGGSYDWVQPIVVLPGTHEDTVRAVATASARAMLQLDGNWDAWLAGPFAKTVRRVKSFARLHTIRDDMENLGHASYDFGCGDAYAHAFAPMPADTLPQPVAKLQVSGLDRERTGNWFEPYLSVGAVIAINGGVEMTTGKTAAQAAHAVMAWLLQADSDTREEFRLSNLNYRMLTVPAATFDLLWTVDALAVIADNGHTEVEPGSHTACAVSVDMFDAIVAEQGK